MAASTAQAQASAEPADPRSRVLVLTDIGNEPDDSESFVRFLLYANTFDVEGLVATTSTWQRGKVQPQLLRERIAAYGEVLPNLRRHAAGYPEAAALAGVVRSGSAEYGMRGVGQGKDTEGSRLIVEAVDRADPRPLHIPIWGGAADLAQALWTVRETRTPQQLAAFVARLRVYSISDQDDAGPWIRRNFPDLFWIASVHGWGQYGMATWIGISGDLMREIKWPDADMVTNTWLERNIRRGPLGALYPPHQFIMEGDTPSFLGLVPNGLNDPLRPEYGGWGGRYVPAWEGAAHRADTQDTFVDASGQRWSGNQATIFRWRRAFQNDFAARVAWTLTADPRQANHNPRLVVNGVAGTASITLTAAPGATVQLSAAGSSDPDGDALTYRWWHYPEPSAVPGQAVPALRIDDADDATAQVVAPSGAAPVTYHVIFEATDAGTPSLTSYRRVLLTVAPQEAHATPTEEVCRNRTGTHDGLFYTFWKDAGTACMTLAGDGRYSIDYDLRPGNLVAGLGWRTGSPSRTIGYNSAAFEPGTNSYLALYGWSTDPLVEYYVVDSWGSAFTPPGEGAPALGTVETDGGTYTIYRTRRVEKPSIRGTATFDQFWSVRTEKRPIGTDQTITFANHVAAWRRHGLELGTMNYQVMATEGYGSTGRASLRVWEE